MTIRLGPICLYVPAAQSPTICYRILHSAMHAYMHSRNFDRRHRRYTLLTLQSDATTAVVIQSHDDVAMQFRKAV